MVVGPEAPLVAGLVDDLGDGRHRGVRADARGRADRGLEGVRQGADARLRRAHRVARDVPRPRGGARPPRVRVLSGGAEGRRARGRQGRDHRPGRARGARGASTCSSPSSASARPRSCSRSSSRARSCRCSRCATASARCRSRRRRTTSASSTATRGRTPAAWAATRRCPGIDSDRAEEIAAAVHQPIVDELRRRGTPFHGVLYAGPDDDRRRRAEGARVQLPASATRRRRRCCRGCAPTCSSCSRRSATPGRPRRRRARVERRLGGDRRARLARLPGVVVERRRDHAACDDGSTGAEVFHAGTAERRTARSSRPAAAC